MRTFGIDYQQTLSVLFLREEAPGQPRLRNVGDGVRQIVPNWATSTHWGSRALVELGPTEGRLDAARLIVPTTGTAFWQGLRRHLAAFLGQTATTPPFDDALIVSLSGDDSAATTAWCRAAGFTQVTCIAATDALLARWLAEPWAGRGGEDILAAALADGKERLIVTIAAGDAATRVAAYHLCWPDRDRLEVSPTSPPVAVADLGYLTWEREFLQELDGYLPGGLPQGMALALRDTALEFGARLRRVNPSMPLHYSGPFHDRLLKPLQLSLDACRQSWPVVTQSASGIQQTVQQMLATVAPGQRPALCLVGGIGAAWPFLPAALAPGYAVWQSDSPADDLACGAAHWLTVGPSFRHTTPGAPSAAQRLLPPPAPTGVAPPPRSSEPLPHRSIRPSQR